MQAFEVNKSSWHFRFVNYWKRKQPGGQRQEELGIKWYEYEQLDFCRYVRMVVTSAAALSLYYTGLTIICLALLALAVLVVVGTITVLLYTPVALWNGDYDHPVVASALAIAVAFFCIFGIPRVVEHALRRQEEKEKRKQHTQKSFIRQAYSSWKEKYCMPVKVVDN